MLIVKFSADGRCGEDLEKRFNIQLPQEYKKFLNKYNGGTTPKTTIKIGRYPQYISAFYGMGKTDGVYNFDNLSKWGIMDDLLKADMFPIAVNISGDYYTLSLSDEGYGEIYLYYHDLLGKKKKIFSDFKKFIKTIKSEPIGHISTMQEREQTAIANGYGYKVKKLRPIWREEIEKFSNLVQEEVVLDESKRRE